MTKPPLILISLLGVMLGLSACGKQGDLDQPAPLFGAKEQAQYEARKQAEAQAAEKAKSDKVVTPNPVSPKEIESAPAPAPAPQN
jgi:hypothetical protein